MPLIRDFKATTIWKAFILNALVSALVLVIAITIKGKLDNYVITKGNEIDRQSTWKSVMITFMFAFISSFLAYTLMYFTFGFGIGMTIKTN